MSSAPEKGTSLPQFTALGPQDRVFVIASMNTVPNTGTVNVATLFTNAVISVASAPPANSTANGVPGQLTYDSNYIYVCLANSSWKRATLSSF